MLSDQLCDPCMFLLEITPVYWASPAVLGGSFMLWRAGNATLTLTPPLNLWLWGYQGTFVGVFFFSALSYLILMTIHLGDMLPKQKPYHELMFTFTYYLYYILITSVLLCFHLQNQISHMWCMKNIGTENVRRTPYLLEQKEFRIRFTSSQSESISLTEPEMSVYCFSRIFSHLPIQMTIFSISYN